MTEAEALKPSLSLLVKLGSIAVHVDEICSPSAHRFDYHAIKTLIDDPEVSEWVKAMGALLPVKRE